MDWLDFTVQMSNAWAWPLVTSGIVVFLRKPIKSAATGIVARLADLRRLKAPGVELDFEREVKELAATTAATTDELRADSPKALPATEPEDVVLPSETAGERLSKYEQLARLDPRAAILLSFSDLEGSIRDRFHQLYPEYRPGVGFARIIDQLHKDGRLDDDIAGSLRQMSKIRNQVAHERTELDLDIVDYFIDSVGNTIRNLILSDFFGTTGADPLGPENRDA